MLEPIPVSQKEAFAFVREHHRHHSVPMAALFWLGVADEDGVLCGVAITNRPIARALDDGLTAEVTRLCTLGTPNACSHLLGRSRRIAIEKGYRRGVTYILESESGASLRAAGWGYLGMTRGDTWHRPNRRDGRKRRDGNTGRKKKYGWGAWPALQRPNT